jgi:hypothetical protein
VLSGVAVDCGWLCCLDDLAYDDLGAALGFWQRLLRENVPILLDHDGHILAEYDRNLSDRTLGRKFLTKAFKAGNIMAFDGRPTKACRDALVAMHFDPSDIPYVAIAQRAGGAYLTHEVKHVEPSRVATILRYCGASVGGLAAVAALFT